MASKNEFSINDDSISINKGTWDKVAFASIRDDYQEEFTSITWSINNGYLYNTNLGYLHIYIIKKWYGEELYKEMKDKDYVIDHIDNNSFNCKIDNLFFLKSANNKAKGLTFDPMRSTMTPFIALNIVKDFSTQLFQITIVFNYPSKLILDDMKDNAVAELSFLLYDTVDYRIVLNDAESILLEYENNKTFTPDRLKMVDYHIEGQYGIAGSIERYKKYLKGELGGQIFFFIKKSPLENWTLEAPRNFLYLRGTPTRTNNCD